MEVERDLYMDNIHNRCTQMNETVWQQRNYFRIFSLKEFDSLSDGWCNISMIISVCHIWNFPLNLLHHWVKGIAFISKKSVPDIYKLAQRNPGKWLPCIHHIHVYTFTERKKGSGYFASTSNIWPRAILPMYKPGKMTHLKNFRD